MYSFVWFGAVVVLADDFDWLDRVTREVVQYESRRQLESAATGMAHGQLVANLATANASEVLLAHAKLACHFDDADRAEKSYALSSQLDPSVAATWHGLGRVRLGRLATAAEAASAAEAFRRAAELGGGLLPLMFRWTALRVAGALGGERPGDDDLLCAVADAVLTRVGRARASACNDFFSFKLPKTVLGDRGYVVLHDILPHDVHRNLIAPWYEHLYGKADRAALVAAGPAGLVLESLEVATKTHRVKVDVRGRWHPGNRRVELWGDPLADVLNHHLAPVAEAALGEHTLLLPTYPWPVHYDHGGGIDLHLDQPDNELSLSYQVRILGGRAWPLHFVDSGLRLAPGEKGPAELPLDAACVSAAPPVALSDNSAVLYRGREIVHWRPRQQARAEIYQLVFAWRRIDKRACHGSL